MCSCKPSFHMSGKSQTIRDFTIPDFADISENRQMLVLDSPDSDFGGKMESAPKIETCNLRIGNELRTIADVPESTNLSFHNLCQE